MTRSVACLLAAALGLPASALAQSPYHVRVPTPKIGLAQNKDAAKDKDVKEKPKDAQPKQKDAPKEEDKPNVKDAPKDPAAEAPAARPIMNPVNPYPPPAPPVRDPRFMAWQQVYPGPGAPPHVEMAGHGAMMAGRVGGHAAPGLVPVEAPDAPHAAVAPAASGPGAVVAPLPLPQAPVSAPAASQAPARPTLFSTRSKKERMDGERTIDIVRDGRKGWRVSDGPR